MPAKPKDDGAKLTTDGEGPKPNLFYSQRIRPLLEKAGNPEVSPKDQKAALERAFGEVIEHFSSIASTHGSNGVTVIGLLQEAGAERRELIAARSAHTDQVTGFNTKAAAIEREASE